MFKAAMVGAAVVAACVIVPVVHFITALPAPFIGGYIAGARTAVTPGQAILLGLLISLIAVAPLAAALAIMVALVGFSVSFVLIVGAFYLFYSVALGSLGAVAGGASARKQDPA